MRLTIPYLILISAAYGTDFTTYVGGTIQDARLAATDAVVADSAGNTYVVGNNAFVTKLDSVGNVVSTATFGSGGVFSHGYSVALDSSGNLWVGGQTLEPNFPLLNALQTTGVSSGSGFLVKMAPDGTVLYSSYFGGTLGASAVYSVATDQSGNVYATGFTAASDFSTTAGLPASPVSGGSAPVYGLFAAKLDSTGQQVVYATVIAGPVSCDFCSPVPKTVGAGIAVDGSGNAVVAGTSNTELPAVTGATSSSGGAFALKIGAAGNELIYFEYLGAEANGGTAVPPSITFGARPIAVDASGNAYVTGYAGGDFQATPGAYQAYGAPGNPEAFALKLDPAGATEWATFLGGQSTPNAGAAITVDSANNIWLTGANGTFPTQYPSFVAELNADGSALAYMARFPQASAGQDIAVDANGTVHFAGPIGLVSTITPTATATAGRVLSIVNAGSGEFSGTIAPGEIVSLYGTGLAPATPVTANPENGVFPKSLGGVMVTVDGAAIPLLYVSDSQINAEIPSPLNGVTNGLVDVRVTNESATLPDFRPGLASSALGAFYSSGAYLAVTNGDGTVNSQSNPAQANSYVSLWTTGLGSPGVVMDGNIAAAPDNLCSGCQVTFLTYNFSVTETVQYAGLAPGLIDGLMQINALVPVQQLGTQTPQLHIYFAQPGAPFPVFLGYMWVSQ